MSNAGWILIDRIKRAVEPFSLGSIIMNLDETPTTPGVFATITIRSSVFHGEVFKHTIYDRDMHMLYESDVIPYEVGEKAGEFFRNIYIPPSDNHILGEN